MIPRGAVGGLGGTEIPLTLHESGAGVPLIDAGKALAQRAVAWSMRHSTSWPVA